MIKFKNVILKHRADAKGKVPIYIRLTKKKKQKYINTKLRCKLNEWNKKTQKVNSQNINYKTINIMLDEFLNNWSNKYYSIPIEQREVISIDDFINYEKKDKNLEQSIYLFKLFEAKIERLKQINKIGTSKYYSECLNSIKKHNKNKDIKLSDVNYAFLKKYEQALKVNGNIDNGIAIKMRSIRSIYNEAIELGLISREKYPFNQYKISSLKQDKKYRAISLDQINMIKNLDPDIYPNLKLSKDIFLFSYYTGGMNFIDLINLNKSDIYDDDSRVTYIRSKTKGVLDFKLNENAKKIVEYYKRFNIGTKYIFPILLKDNLSPKQIFYRKHKCLSKLNKDLKIIASLCDINFNLTSYVARHSFASNLKQLGVATDQISEAMNHKDIRVTQVYLKKFENETIDNLMDKLL